MSNAVSSSVDAWSYRIRLGPERGDLRLRNRPLTWRRFVKVLRSGGPRPFREEEGERRACARRALRPYLAAVGLGDLAGYGQPQARAVLGAGGISPVEAFEDEVQLILRDADARIRNFKRDPVAVLPHTYRDVPALGRVAHGVVQEYGGGLGGAVPIEGGLDISFREDTFDRHLSVVGVLGCLRRILGDCS